MPRHPYSVAVPSTGGRLHPRFLRKRGLGRKWSPLWLKRDGVIRKTQHGGRLHPLPFWKGRGLGRGLRTLPQGGTGGARKTLFQKKTFCCCFINAATTLTPHTHSGYFSASSSYLDTFLRCQTWLPSPIQLLPWQDCNNRWQYRQDVLA